MSSSALSSATAGSVAASLLSQEAIDREMTASLSSEERTFAISTACASLNGFSAKAGISQLREEKASDITRVQLRPRCVSVGVSALEGAVSSASRSVLEGMGRLAHPRRSTDNSRGFMNRMSPEQYHRFASRMNGIFRREPICTSLSLFGALCFDMYQQLEKLLPFNRELSPIIEELCHLYGLCNLGISIRALSRHCTISPEMSSDADMSISVCGRKMGRIWEKVISKISPFTVGAGEIFSIFQQDLDMFIQFSHPDLEYAFLATFSECAGGFCQTLEETPAHLEELPTWADPTAYILFLHRAIHNNAGFPAATDLFLRVHEQLSKAGTEKHTPKHRSQLKQDIEKGRQYFLAIMSGMLENMHMLCSSPSLPKESLSTRCVTTGAWGQLNIWVNEIVSLLENRYWRILDPEYIPLGFSLDRFKKNIQLGVSVLTDPTYSLGKLPSIKAPLSPLLQVILRFASTQVERDVIDFFQRTINNNDVGLQDFARSLAHRRKFLESTLWIAMMRKGQKKWEKVQRDLVIGAKALLPKHHGLITSALREIARQDPLFRMQRKRYATYVREFFFRQSLYFTLLHLLAKDALAIGCHESREEVLCSSEHIYPPDIVIEYAHMSELDPLLDELVALPPRPTTRAISTYKPVIVTFSEKSSSSEIRQKVHPFRLPPPLPPHEGVSTIEVMATVPSSVMVLAGPTAGGGTMSPLPPGEKPRVEGARGREEDGPSGLSRAAASVSLTSAAAAAAAFPGSITVASTGRPTAVSLTPVTLASTISVTPVSAEPVAAASAGAAMSRREGKESREVGRAATRAEREGERRDPVPAFPPAAAIPTPKSGEKRRKYVARLEAMGWERLTPPGGGSDNAMRGPSGEMIPIALGGTRREFGARAAGRARVVKRERGAPR